jgi:hypothetical protein
VRPPRGPTLGRHRIFPGDRRWVQTFAAYAALSLVRDVARGKID